MTETPHEALVEACASEVASVLAGGRKYRAWDQEKWLGDPPWSGEALSTWEDAHGHDARIKCYPEYGCRLAATDEAVDIARAALKVVADALPEERIAYRQDSVQSMARIRGFNSALHEVRVLLVGEGG